ncbi:MAG: urease accessory protein UreF [Verrucomicrobia bacterium]|nr:urease accessory protein UreF [Verrucomicrobiota bacterium]
MHDWLLQVLQTNDSFFPTGSYAHSYGLEGLVQAGVVTDMATCAEAMEHILGPALARVDLPVTRLSFLAAQTEDVAGLLALGARTDAAKPMRELREASLGVGRQRLTMLETLAPGPLTERLGRDADAGAFLPHAPVMTGIECAIFGATEEAALQACLYQAGAAWIGASLKLLSVGQTAAQRALRRFLNTGPALLAHARGVEEAAIGNFSPLLDIASARHESADARMFIS